MSSSQYGGYDPQFVTEWVRVQIPREVGDLQRLSVDKRCYTKERNNRTHLGGQMWIKGTWFEVHISVEDELMIGLWPKNITVTGKILAEPTPLATNRKNRQARIRWRQAKPTMATTSIAG
ncbi:hypothetical protein TNCV_2520921 [Trichonephila clavipes]|nr:hypothetical protein TNCV_2520921 [Trichonephila clavipes]